VAAGLSGAALAEDAVTVRRVRASGVSEAALRRQLVAIPTPRVRRFVFVRRVRLRAGPHSIGRAMQAALAQLAENERPEILTFPDFPALVVACARAALGGGLGSAWHWRMMGVPPAAGPGEAVATLLIAFPLEAGSAVAALAERGLLAPVWRDMSEDAATRLSVALAVAAGFSVPTWPIQASRAPATTAPTSVRTLLTRTTSMWAEALAPGTPRPASVMAAAVLSLLRWSPGVLRSAGSPIWPALVTHLAGGERPAARSAPSGAVAPPVPGVASPGESSAPPHQHNSIAEAATEPAPPSQTHGEAVVTRWGGVLFLINVLWRLDMESLLVAGGPDAPSGWRMLHDLGVAFGMPPDEPMAQFLAEADLDTTTPPSLLAEAMAAIEALYHQPNGLWPLPLEQRARLWATETHLDLDLETTSIDLALRLSGLDLDPGWVPWLGRVVRFHYDQLPTQFQRGG
jgi:hypothetical protein